MPLSPSACLQGVYCITSVHPVTSSGPLIDWTEAASHLQPDSCETRACHGTKMSQSDPSEFELHQKARSLGLLLRQEGSIVSGLNFQVSPLATKGDGLAEENRESKMPRQILPGISSLAGGDGTANHRNQLLTRAVALPKIPSIKHPFERKSPPIMQREGTDPPLSLTTSLVTPRSKTSLNPASFTGKKFKSSTTGNRWSTHSDVISGKRGSNLHPSASTRLIISPRSKADLTRSPGDFYQRKFPHVHLDRSLVEIQPPKDRDQHTRAKLPADRKGVTDTIRTTDQLFALTRSKTDLMAVEQLINRTTERAKSTRSWVVSGWLDGMTCNPKKLHRRDFTYFVK